tara:strand:- start:641 stop:886 length:246 start_codon:yes stop_codon:yes gene_type:complete
MHTKDQSKDSNNQFDALSVFLTGGNLLNWFKFEDSISPPIRKLLPYDDPSVPELKWEGMQTWEELMFIYINKDLWGFKNYA